MTNFNCPKCHESRSALEMFPGNVCLACWRTSPESQVAVSADELAEMFRVL